MDLQAQGGSAPHLSRLPRAISSLPGSRGKPPLAARPTKSTTARNIVEPRRKRTTDQAFSTDEDLSNGENKRILRPRNSSSSSSPAVESLRLVSTESSKLVKAVAGDARSPLSILIGAGAPWKRFTSKLPKHVPTTDSISKQLSKSGENNTAEESGRSSHPIFPSAILNVGLFDVATENATQPTNYTSFNALDDLSRWDMDSLPSIPSPPTSPDRRSFETRNTTPTPPLLNPFLDNIDDDALLENEIPFPLNRHSKVIHENMGVKKSKHIARARSISNTTISHVSPRSEPLLSLPPTLLPGLPNPLPLRPICQNKTTTSPFVAATSHKIPKKPTPTPSPKVSSGPSSSWKDSLGCIHLGAADVELSIAFPQTPHYEVWDMGDDAYVACPVLLCLMAKDSQPWSGKPLALPDVTFFDIRCEDVALPSRMSVYNPLDEYSTHYTGTRFVSPQENPLGTTRETRVDRDDITIEAKWVRTYVKPGVSSRRPLSGASSSYSAFGPATTPPRAASPRDTTAGARGWYLKFWVPVPTRLFVKRETRVFTIGARVWMMGDEERELSLDENADGRVHSLFAEGQMTVSHLRTLREMDGY